MKTLDEIINNENYERLNGALVERSIELAQKVRKAMDSAEIKEVGDFRIITKSANSGFSDKSLYIASCDSEHVLEYHNLEIRKSQYFAGDFNCWMQAANGKDRLHFLNCAKIALEKIEAIKNKRMADVELALKEVESL